MNNKVVFGQYFDTNSWMHRLDPRTKIISLFLLMIGVFLIKNLYILIGFFGFVLLLVLSTKIPLAKFLKSLRMMLFLLFFTTIFQVLFNKVGTKLASFSLTMTVLTLSISVILLISYFIIIKFIKKFKLLLLIAFMLMSLYLQSEVITTRVLFNYTIEVYSKGLITAGFVIVRIIALILISSLLTLTTKPTDLNNGLESVLSPLEKIGLKTSILAMMISIALRFIPTLINEADRILKAQASRGVDFKEGNIGQKVVQIISLLIPMFIVSFKRAEELANAMEARGYIPGEKRTKLYVLQFKTFDYLSLGFSILFIIFGIILRGYFANTV